MKILDGIENQFCESNINFVKEYFSFIFYMEDYLKRMYLTEICEKIYSVLEDIFVSAHSDKNKEFTK